MDLLALVGDAVDNVPGVAGIGDKGARDLVKQFGPLEAVLENADAIKRASYREGLKAHRADALLSKQLVTLRTDVPVALDLEAFRRPGAGPGRGPRAVRGSLSSRRWPASSLRRPGRPAPRCASWPCLSCAARSQEARCGGPGRRCPAALPPPRRPGRGRSGWPSRGRRAGPCTCRSGTPTWAGRTPRRSSRRSRSCSRCSPTRARARLSANAKRDRIVLGRHRPALRGPRPRRPRGGLSPEPGPARLRPRRHRRWSTSASAARPGTRTAIAAAGRRRRSPPAQLRRRRGRARAGASTRPMAERLGRRGPPAPSTSRWRCRSSRSSADLERAGVKVDDGAARAHEPRHGGASSRRSRSADPRARQGRVQHQLPSPAREVLFDRLGMQERQEDGQDDGRLHGRGRARGAGGCASPGSGDP